VAVVALLVHSARADAAQVAGDAADWLTGRGHRALPYRLAGPGRVQGPEGTLALTDLDLAGVDLAVSLGGDGTFLRLITPAWVADVPILGINFGHLGYLLEQRPDDLVPVLAQVLEGGAPTEDRVLLAVRVAGEASGPGGAGALGGSVPAVVGEDGTRWWPALNEVVLEKTLFGHTVRLTTAIDGEEFLTYSADGLLVATPTGSTAYNLSAGGPVVAPRLAAMVVSPVAPHLSFDRSLVLGPDQEVRVGVAPERPVALVVDGQELGRLEPGAVVTCRLAPRPVRLVAPGGTGLGALLRDTLAGRRR
jgi:NAD+ kinase